MGADPLVAKALSAPTDQKPARRALPLILPGTSSRMSGLAHAGVWSPADGCYALPGEATAPGRKALMLRLASPWRMRRAATTLSSDDPRAAAAHDRDRRSWAALDIARSAWRPRAASLRAPVRATYDPGKTFRSLWRKLSTVQASA